MTINELYKYAYLKKPLNEIYPDISLVPSEFIIEWLKDSYDYKRLHSEEELKEWLALTPVQILEWLEEAMLFVWETNSMVYLQKR